MKQLTIKEIVNKVTKSMGTHLNIYSRKKKFVDVKRMVCYIATDVYKYQICDVSEYMHMHHSTIIHHRETARNFIQINERVFCSTLENLQGTIGQA